MPVDFGLPAASGSGTPTKSAGWRTRLARLVAHPAFQRWATTLPLTRWIARREGDALFDLVQGFVSSQVLFAVVQLDLLPKLLDGPKNSEALAQGTDVPADRLERLLQAAAALGLMHKSGTQFGITPRGATLLAVPGLTQMIRHHDVLYRDLSDPVSFLKGDTETELAGFWPYVFGAGAAQDPQTAEIYSDLMAQSQGLVAQDTLRTVSLRGVSHLVDVGGGSGAFAEAALAATPGLSVTLYDLPKVVDSANQRLAASPVRDRLQLVAGSFRDDPLPQGAEAMSLVRVLYDHQDATVVSLLAKVFAGLPSGGRVIVSEPMSGGATPERSGDVYFTFYCMAMRTGTVRSQARIAELLQGAGFRRVSAPRALRPFVTSVVTAIKP